MLIHRWFVPKLVHITGNTVGFLVEMSYISKYLNEVIQQHAYLGPHITIAAGGMTHHASRLEDWDISISISVYIYIYPSIYIYIYIYIYLYISISIYIYLYIYIYIYIYGFLTYHQHISTYFWIFVAWLCQLHPTGFPWIPGSTSPPIHRSDSRNEGWELTKKTSLNLWKSQQKSMENNDKQIWKHCYIICSITIRAKNNETITNSWNKINATQSLNCRWWHWLPLGPGQFQDKQLRCE